jgi:cell division protein ZapA
MPGNEARHIATRWASQPVRLHRGGEFVAEEEGWAMAQVKVVVNGRSFRMGCKDGEEARVRDLGAEIDGHVQRIKGGSKAVQDERLFLMAALLMADQLWEAREEIQRLQRMALDPRAYQVIDGGAQAMQRELNKAMEAPHPRAKGSA